MHEMGDVVTHDEMSSVLRSGGRITCMLLNAQQDADGEQGGGLVDAIVRQL
jgi:hypothetical protein